MSQTLRLCTWNIQLGMQLATVLREVKEHEDFLDLDLLALQEASVHDGCEDARLVADVLGAEYGCYQVTADSLAGRPQANALIWNTARVKVLSTTSLTLPGRHEVKLRAYERTLLRVLPYSRRISLVVEAQFGSETMRIYAAHLDVVGFEHKRQQLSAILRDAHLRPSVDSTIVAGDFNTFKIRSRPSWAGLAGAVREASFYDITGEIVWTYALNRLNMRQKLDAILLGRPGPYRYRSWTIEASGSDHIPVFADITLD